MSFIGSIYNYTLDPILELVDPGVGLKTEAKATAAAYQSGDRWATLQHGLGFIRGINDSVRYPLTALEKTGEFLPGIWASLPNAPHFLSFLSGAQLTQGIAGLGIATSALGFIFEGVGLYRQAKLWDCFPPAGEAVNVSDTLHKLNALMGTSPASIHNFLESLPEYLRKEFTNDPLGAKAHLDGIILNHSVNSKEGDILVERIHKAAVRQAIAYFLGIVACLFGLAAAISTLTATAPITIIVLTIIGLAFTGVSVLMKRGWAENPEDGFRWRLCLPECMREWHPIDSLQSSIIEFLEKDSEDVLIKSLRVELQHLQEENNKLLRLYNEAIHSKPRSAPKKLFKASRVI